MTLSHFQNLVSFPLSQDVAEVQVLHVLTDFVVSDHRMFFSFGKIYWEKQISLQGEISFFFVTDGFFALSNSKTAKDRIGTGGLPNTSG